MKTPGFFQSVVILMGAILGVGIFGLPFVSFHAGVLPLVGFFVLAAIILYGVSYAYGQVVLGTSSRHRLPGYVEAYLGNHWKTIAFLTTAVGIWGALLSYIIIGGSFLGEVFMPLAGGSEIFYTTLFFLVGTFFVFRDAKTIARTEIVLLGLFFLIIILFLIFGINKISLNNLSVIKTSNSIIPYGVAIFALWGVNVIPDIIEIGNLKKQTLKKVIILSLAASTILYIVYALTIVGVTGKDTSIDSITGLTDHFGEKALILGYIFGIIATFTSFIAIGLDLKKVFMIDYGYHQLPALLIAVGMPMALFLGGISNYIGVIAVIGGSVLAVESIIILKTYEKFADDRSQLNGQHGNHKNWTRPLMVLLGLGTILGLITPFILSRL